MLLARDTAAAAAAADSLYSEKYHLKKIALKVAKGTVSPNLATVRPYHSNKHSVAREGAKKRGEMQLLFSTLPLFRCSSLSLLSRTTVNPSSFSE